MKKIAFVLMLCLLALTGQAQESPVRASIDWAVSDGPGRAVIAGWAFNCSTEGQQPFSVRVYYSTGTTAALATVTQRYSGLRRDDVASAFGGCGALSHFTGYQLVATGIPSGPRTLTVEWADSLGARYVSTQVTVQ